MDNFLLNEFKNLVIMDSINEGITITMIIDSMEIKNHNIQNNEIKKNNQIIINTIKKELKNKLEEQKSNIDNHDYYDDQDYYKIVNNINCSNKYIINLYDFIDLSMEEEYFVSEKENLRCLETFSNHYNFIDFEKYKNLDELLTNPNSYKLNKYSPKNSSNIGDDIYDSNCLDWLKKICIAGLHRDWYYKLKYKPMIEKDNNLLNNKPSWYVDLINKYKT